ncbi:hypothetical protein EHS25_005341 [Saitozyma podzolica]|uniref:FMN hydroxy acid dehydrogenase domain-containing protein n=1 Tax=Saitozyma podzolica TaxID=1890683 RepID=A0A427XYZ6_9TREE|nr:hypothetical protein EHS25_005341 [Saitozyma podzolica]
MNRQLKRDTKVVCLADLEREGSRNLSKMIGEYYNEGAMDLITLNDNKAAYDRYSLRPRLCRDVCAVDTSAAVWGAKSTIPVGFAPTAMHAMAHPDGEIATSRADSRVGVPMILSHYSNSSIEDVVATGKSGGNPYAMQLCMVNDWDTNISILRRAERAGCKAFVLTLDTPSLGRRLNEHRNNFKLPEGLSFPNMPEDVDMRNMIQDDPRMTYMSSVSWDTVRTFIAATHLEVFLKGILTAEDALKALGTGAKGIIVSTHGGRRCLSAHVDSGIRRGSDIFKALAIGADFCWVGRPAIWGLAYKGDEGVELALRLLRDELQTTMWLCGCSTVHDITRAHLGRLSSSGEFVPLQPRGKLLPELHPASRAEQISQTTFSEKNKMMELESQVARVRVAAV